MAAFPNGHEATPSASNDPDALWASARRFREVLDNSRDLIYRVRLSDLAFEYVSPSALQVSGFTADEVARMGLPAILERVHPEDRQFVPTIESRPGEPAIKDWDAPRGDFRFRHQDGQYRWLHAVRATVKDEHGAPVAGIGIIRDVTEQHRIAEELRLYRDRLEDLVAQRTGELAQANASLAQELAERRRAQQELCASEERFRQLAENIREAFWLSEPNSRRILYVSPAFEQVCGCSPEAVYADPAAWIKAVHPEDRPAVATTLAQQAAGSDTDCQFRMCHSDGRLRWVRNRGFPIRSATGEVYRIAGVAEDVTERVRAEQLLVIQRDLGLALLPTTSLDEALNALLEATLRVDGIDCAALYLVDDARHEFRLVAHRNLSPQFVEAIKRVLVDSPLGQLAKQLQGHYWPHGQIPLPPELLAPEGVRSGACLPVVFDGRVVATLNIGSHTLPEISEVVRHALETIAARVGSVIDRIQAKDALADSENRFRILCHTLPVGIFLAQADGTTLYTNPFLQDICNLSAAESLELRWQSVVHPDDRAGLRQRMEDARRQRKRLTHELRLLPAGGTLRWIRVETVPLGSAPDEAQLRVGIVQDLTERRQAEEAARQHREQLAHAARISTLGEMAAGLAHELAQPLSAIRNFAEGGLKKLKSSRGLAADAAVVLQKIAAQAERASEFILRMKNFARRTPPQRVPADLNDMVRGALDFVMPQAQAAGIPIQLDLSPDLPQVRADPIQLEHAILNLVWNAIEALASVPAGERGLHIRTHTVAGPAAGFEVRDTGPGLSAEVRAHLLDPFFTTKPDGTGLGLPISRTLIEELHGGRLWVEPAAERGTRAGFSLPAQE